MTDKEHVVDTEASHFIERLRQLVAIAGSANALVRKAGVSPGGFQRYLSGGQPTRKVLIALAHAANVDLTWLMTGKGSPNPQITVDSTVQSLTRLPLYRPPLTASEHHRGNDDTVIGQHNGDDDLKVPAQNIAGLGFCRFWLSRHGLDAKDIAGHYMPGNSMAPTIAEGDTLLINVREREVVDGNIYAIRDGEALLVKRIQRHPGGRLRLICDNPAYSLIEVNSNDVDIVGRVVWRGSLF